MPEQQNIEWKTSWRDEYLKWICGFANAKGGKLFIGIYNDGKVVGIVEYKRLLDDIPNKIQNHLGIICDVNLHKKDALYYIEIDIKPNENPISYHYQRITNSEWIKRLIQLNSVAKTQMKSLIDNPTMKKMKKIPTTLQL